MLPGDACMQTIVINSFPSVAVIVAISTLSACSHIQAQAPRIVRQIDWAGRGVWLKADLHMHTRFSDGKYPLGELVRAAAEHGCDAIAITDHADDTLNAATPEYLDAIRTARAQHPTLVVVAGLEWNVPPGKGDEHAGVLFPSAMETLERFAAFKSQFDDYHRKGEPPDLADAALRWLAPTDKAAIPPVVMFNHPSRKPESASAPRLVFEHSRGVSPLVVGIEGAPGHQRATPLGAYESTAKPIDRWDPIVAVTGGVWDEWLRHGLDVWAALADSDFHDESGEFWPCQFAATWIYAPDRTVDGVLRALRAGSFFAEHGHIVTKATLEARVAGQPRPMTPGETLEVQPGAIATATLRLTVPARDYLGGENHIDQVELVGISSDGARLLFSGPPGASEAFTVSVTVPPTGIVLRARGSRATSDGNLVFYTNPIRLTTVKR
jgi:hypothetical protein